MSELITATTSAFSARWNDKGSGANRNGGFWHPNSQRDLRPLGSVGVPHYNDINGSYTQTWNDQKSGASKDGAFWCPPPPPPPNGYVVLGDVAMTGLTQAPATSDVWCVRQDLVKQDSFASNSFWDDKKSGAKSDVSIWEIRGIGRTDPDTEIGITAVYNGAIRASQTYNAPDSIFALVPLV
ncbi:vacuolar protein sorting-associated protein 62 [Trichoderma compactum]